MATFGVRMLGVLVVTAVVALGRVPVAAGSPPLLHAVPSAERPADHCHPSDPDCVDSDDGGRAGHGDGEDGDGEDGDGDGAGRRGGGRGGDGDSDRGGSRGGRGGERGGDDAGDADDDDDDDDDDAGDEDGEGACDGLAGRIGCALRGE